MTLMGDLRACSTELQMRLIWSIIHLLDVADKGLTKQECLLTLVIEGNGRRHTATAIMLMTAGRTGPVSQETKELSHLFNSSTDTVQHTDLVELSVVLTKISECTHARIDDSKRLSLIHI